VVVTQTLPTIGNRVATTGPCARSFAISWAGSRKNASLEKSAWNVMIDPVVASPSVAIVDP
jgi:hypothetical protein